MKILIALHLLGVCVLLGAWIVSSRQQCGRPVDTDYCQWVCVQGKPVCQHYHNEIIDEKAAKARAQAAKIYH